VKQTTIVVEYEGSSSAEDILSWLEEAARRYPALERKLDVRSLRRGWPSVVMVDEPDEPVSGPTPIR